MKCPKCGYTSFAYLERCGQCGRKLDEVREAFGLYALRPTPLDLAAHITASMRAQDAVDSADEGDAAPSLTIDVSRLGEIGLELGDTSEDAHSTPPESLQAPDAPPEIELAVALETEGESELLAIASGAEPAQDAEAPSSLPIDLSQLDEIGLELTDTPTDARSTPPESPQTQAAAPGIEPALVLEIEEDGESLVIEPEAAGAEPAKAPETPPPAPVDITQLDEIELEMEVEELELEDKDDDPKR